MSPNTKQDVDPNSADFKEGVDAGLDSTQETKNWQAGLELGQELKGEGEKREPASEPLRNQRSTSRFVENILGGNLQDEKDETAE
ncbi:MAG TPA: hypothetical protein VIF64_07410 [Pyrinomonadaceae bacterium]|jgi:hypothetical protein